MDIYAIRELFLWTIYAICAGTILIDAVYVSILLINKLYRRPRKSYYYIKIR